MRLSWIFATPILDAIAITLPFISHPQLDHGYSVTSFLKGSTVDRLIVNDHSMRSAPLINHEQPVSMRMSTPTMPKP